MGTVGAPYVTPHRYILRCVLFPPMPVGWCVGQVTSFESGMQLWQDITRTWRLLAWGVVSVTFLPGRTCLFRATKSLGSGWSCRKINCVCWKLSLGKAYFTLDGWNIYGVCLWRQDHSDIECDLPERQTMFSRLIQVTWISAQSHVVGPRWTRLRMESDYRRERARTGGTFGSGYGCPLDPRLIGHALSPP